MEAYDEAVMYLGRIVEIGAAEEGIAFGSAGAQPASASLPRDSSGRNPEPDQHPNGLSVSSALPCGH